MVRKIFIYTIEEVKRLSPKVNLHSMKRSNQESQILKQQSTPKTSHPLWDLHTDLPPCL
ncbi:hypothetical protein GBA52_008942 [Prunus armeniaca]|nr:hypothetical protein GBA52_008942 [Prunus armeniaca]